MQAEKQNPASSRDISGLPPRLPSIAAATPTKIPAPRRGLIDSSAPDIESGNASSEVVVEPGQARSRGIRSTAGSRSAATARPSSPSGDAVDGKQDLLALGESMHSWQALRRNITIERIRSELDRRGQRAIGSPAAVLAMLVVALAIAVLWLAFRQIVFC